MTPWRWIWHALVLFAVAGASFAVTSTISSRQYGNGPGCGMGVGTGASPCMVMRYLELTPQQEREVAAITERFCTEQHAGGVGMQQARARLLEELKAPKPDRARVDAALDELAARQAELQTGAERRSGSKALRNGRARVPPSG